MTNWPTNQLDWVYRTIHCKEQTDQYFQCINISSSNEHLTGMVYGNNHPTLFTNAFNILARKNRRIYCTRNVLFWCEEILQHFVYCLHRAFYDVFLGSSSTGVICSLTSEGAQNYYTFVCELSPDSELNDTPSLMLYIFDNFVCERMKWRSGLVSTSFAWIKTELKYSDTTTGLVSTSVVVWIETDNVMLMRTGVLEICFLSEAMIIHWDSYSCMNGRWMFNWKNKHMARYLPLWHH